MKKPKKTKISSLKKTTQALANRYARERDCFGDSGAACISCGVWKSFEELDGGHFIPTTSSAIRFDERNINAQCTRCNRFLHGNPRHYYKGMLRKFGEDVVDDLEAREFDTKKWTREELEEIRQYYREKLDDLHRGTLPSTPTRVGEGDTGMEMSRMFKDLAASD